VTAGAGDQCPRGRDQRCAAEDAGCERPGDALRRSLEGCANATAISAKGKAIGQKADTLGPKLSTKAANGQDIINFRNGINAQYVFLLGNLEGNDVVTQPVRERFLELEKLWSSLKAQVDVLELQDVPEFNKLLGDGKVEGVIVPKPKPKVVM
jgi:hypothetical protein